MKLKAKEENETGLNIKFINEESGRTLSREHVIEQIRRGNRNYEAYEVVHMKNGTEYIRSKPDGKKDNNIE